MSLAKTVDQIEYPESDGKPMGETDLHRDWMVRILEIMRYRYRGQRVYIASDLLVYFEKGKPSSVVVPDDFVVKDCDPGRRRTFKIWEEGKVPDVVFEVTSRGSRKADQVKKPQIYAEIGVQEYFLYDPTSEYLTPPLQGFRLVAGKYRAIRPNSSGVLVCEALNITLAVEDEELVMRDAETGDVLETKAEAEHAARMAAEQRSAELEAEIRRLRDELARKPRDSSG